MKAADEPTPEFGQHVDLLIPWYANGSLGVAERAAVDQHIEECHQCRTTLELEQRLTTLMREHRETLDCAPQSGWARLAARLDERGEPRADADSASGVRSARRARRGSFALVQAAQAAAVAALGIALFVLLDGRQGARYHTLTEPDTTLARGIPALRVVFADTTSSARVRALLSHVNGTIRGGPSAQNAYTIELSRSATTAALSPEEATVWLRAQPEILLAEPIGPAD
jgi:anti-sigma factor RsiW